jgi:hypothetical protein
MLFFAIGLAIAAFDSPTGGVTGPFAYGALAVLCAIGEVGGRDLAE